MVQMSKTIKRFSLGMKFSGPVAYLDVSGKYVRYEDYKRHITEALANATAQGKVRENVEDELARLRMGLL